jgi:hypothetical protein
MLIGTWEVFDRQIDGRELRFGSPEHAAYLRGEPERGLRILTEFGAPVVVMSKPCNSEAEHGSLFGLDGRTPRAQPHAAGVHGRPPRSGVVD